MTWISSAKFSLEKKKTLNSCNLPRPIALLFDATALFVQKPFLLGWCLYYRETVLSSLYCPPFE